jgi:CheY-like chemotaxis protein
VDLVVTDMTMPGMTGAELARRLIDIAPHLPIILCSGFSEVISDQQTKAMGIQAFIMKPVVMNDLAATVRRLLDGRSGGGQ